MALFEERNDRTKDAMRTNKAGMDRTLN